MKKPPELWLARHAPVLAEKGLCYGISDLPADETATLQAAKALAARLPEGWPVYASPLRRCQQLAQSLRTLRPDLSINDDLRLRELDFGAWEGRLWAAIERAEFDAWLADFAHACPGGGGESVASLMARVGRAWDDWHAGGAGALWITHAGVMRAAVLLSQGTRMPATAADWPSADMPHEQVLILQGPEAGSI